MRRLLAFVVPFAVVAAVWVSVFAVEARAPGRVVPVGGSLLLTVAIDAEGVRLVRTTHKPGLVPRSDMRSANSIAWSMIDRRGDRIAEGHFDPGPLDLRREAMGEPERVHGDTFVAKHTATNVKVPAVAFDRVEFSAIRDGRRIPLGSITATDVAR